MSEVIVHKSKSDIYTISWGIGDSKDASFEAYMNSELYDVTLTNVSSFRIDGVVTSINAITTFPIQKGLVYTITPLIINNLLESRITFKARKYNDVSININVPTLLSESVQGTKSFFMHPSANKMTVVDSSLINSDNYTADFTFTVNPKTIVDLPIISGFVWTSGFWNHITDRIVLFGRPTTTQSAGAGNFKLCEYHLTGSKSGQIWNINGTVQNSYNTITSDTWSTNEMYPVVDYNNNKITIAGFRKYNAALSNLLTWTYESNGSDVSLLWVSGYPDGTICRKFGYNSNLGSYITKTCFQNGNSYTRYYNFYRGADYGVGVDNITGVVYKASNAITTLFLFSGNTQIATISCACYCANLFIPASVKRRLLIAGMSMYAVQPYQVTLINMQSRTNIITAQTITDTTNTTGYLDADYLNSIEMFALLTTGTAGTAGKRTVHFCSADYDGVNPLLKFKLLLDYDSSYMFTNRLRY